MICVFECFKNIRDGNSMETKLYKDLCYESFQYGSGDIAYTTADRSLHLYEVVDSALHSENRVREKSNHRKENVFVSVHGKEF